VCPSYTASPNAELIFFATIRQSATLCTARTRIRTAAVPVRFQADFGSRTHWHGYNRVAEYHNAPPRNAGPPEAVGLYVLDVGKTLDQLIDRAVHVGRLDLGEEFPKGGAISADIARLAVGRSKLVDSRFHEGPLGPHCT
jgi:hypothetical protein